MGRLSSEVFCLSQYVIAKSCADSQFYEVGPGSSKLLSSNFSCPYGIKQNNFLYYIHYFLCLSSYFLVSSYIY